MDCKFKKPEMQSKFSLPEVSVVSRMAPTNKRLNKISPSLKVLQR